MPHTVDILLVEDDAVDAEITLRALEKANVGDQIHVVEDGVEALEFIYATGAYSERTVSNFPKLILLDLNLPKVSGLQVLEKIKADKQTKQIPIVVLTSSQEKRDLVKSYDLGANSYIVKQVNFNTFTDNIAQVVIYWLLMNMLPY
jgi:two-component system response regulator